MIDLMPDYDAMKGGGSSLADYEQCKKVAKICRRNSKIRVLVPSAPGRRSEKGEDDPKVTDLLDAWYRRAQAGESTDQHREIVRLRFLDIAQEEHARDFIWDLGNVFSRLDAEFHQRETSPDYAQSRGEWLMGKLLAEWLGWTFVDSTELIRFEADGRCDWDQSFALIHEQLAERIAAGERFVVPGFYGADADGKVITFPRNGSDVSGAILAAGIRASRYLNYTDTDGILSADPRIVENPRSVRWLTFRESAEACHLDMPALHADAIYPCKRFGIQIHVLNTNDPDAAGTIITSEAALPERKHPVVCVSAKAGFTLIDIAAPFLDEQRASAAAIFTVLSEHDCPVRALTDGVNDLSIFVETKDLSDEKVKRIRAELEALIPSVTLEVKRDRALVSVIGCKMKGQAGVAGAVFGAIGNADVSIEAIAHAGVQNNIRIGVLATDRERTVQAVYQELIDPPRHWYEPGGV